MKRKLKSSGGETLVELLASILIASLSVVLVFGAVMASATMDRQAQDLDKNYYNVLSMAERQADEDKVSMPAGPAVPQVNITNIDTGSFRSLSVTFYGGEGAVSYVLNSP